MEKWIDSYKVVIERGKGGYYVGIVPALKGCHSQGKTMDELLFNIREAVELCLEVEDE
ncbi:MAG: type II toxin-antitoxin system HicB family antitoxin [Deltaproteobacteria bacterium]|uniref:Type II toxin-antitoxin system HicB family antitoxin n=1 Tax=Candidatus Zymogenus saltonus TaxID=2844893 RepID=A0A9D8KIS8_9DELT|nr:type II toxin-antitoxin system HicB family antitoxin [Candidatus Zymogenus saltonus]